jgi:hypothetical protein
MTSGQEEVKSRLKDFIENHPLSVLTGLALSVGGVVAGVMNYYTDQRLSIADAQHEVKISLLEMQDQKKIADLTSRVASIELRIPGTMPEYLDVTKILIEPERVRGLDSSFKSFAEGRIYVSIPNEDGWNFVETTFLQIFQDTSGLSSQQIPQPLANAWQSEKIYMWRAASSSKFKITPRILAPGSTPYPRTLSFSPSITVEYIDASTLKKRIRAIAGIFLGFPESNVKEKDQSVAQALDDASKHLQHAEDGGGGGAFHSEDVETKRGIVNALETIYSPDVATYTLTSLIADAKQEDLMLGVTHRFESMQRKDNIWYLSEEVTYRDAKILTGTNPKNEAEDVKIDEETFFCGSGSGGYLIRIYLPRSGGMLLKNAAWTRSWLMGLRIPV